jgi:hypothetical protein
VYNQITDAPKKGIFTSRIEIPRPEERWITE